MEKNDGIYNFKKRIEKGDGLRSRERERREVKFGLWEDAYEISDVDWGFAERAQEDWRINRMDRRYVSTKNRHSSDSFCSQKEWIMISLFFHWCSFCLFFCIFKSSIYILQREILYHTSFPWQHTMFTWRR